MFNFLSFYNFIIILSVYNFNKTIEIITKLNRLFDCCFQFIIDSVYIIVCLSHRIGQKTTNYLSLSPTSTRLSIIKQKILYDVMLLKNNLYTTRVMCKELGNFKYSLITSEIYLNPHTYIIYLYLDLQLFVR